ncbi:MAG: acyl-CoA dehydrogenase family protein [Dehalococcoidia bacterium]
MNAPSTSAPKPLAPVDAAGYLDGVRAILPGIRERAAETDRLGRMPEETVRDLDEAGVFRGLQPRQWGGLELDPLTYFESIVLIGSACGSTGWVAGVVGVHPWELALLSDRAQRDVWGEDPRTRISSSYAPTGRVARTEGGFLLSGTWRFSSGVDLCEWAFLGGVPAGEEAEEMRAFLVSRRDFEVDHDSWQVAGLRGTGSKSVHLKSAFVPEYRCHRMVDANNGINPGWEVNDRPLYHLPWMEAVFSYGIAAPAIGAATGALESFVEQNRGRVGAYGGAPLAVNPGLHRRLAEALGEVRDARTRMSTTWREFGAIVAAGESISAEAKAQSRYETARAITNCMYAVLSVFEMGGGGVMNLANPIQRYLRDLLAMKNHPMGAIESTASTYARLVLGVPLPNARG